MGIFFLRIALRRAEAADEVHSKQFLRFLDYICVQYVVMKSLIETRLPEDCMVFFCPIHYFTHQKFENGSN